MEYLAWNGGQFGGWDGSTSIADAKVSRVSSRAGRGRGTSNNSGG